MFANRALTVEEFSKILKGQQTGIVVGERSSLI